MKFKNAEIEKVLQGVIKERNLPEKQLEIIEHYCRPTMTDDIKSNILAIFEKYPEFYNALESKESLVLSDVQRDVFFGLFDFLATSNTWKTDPVFRSINKGELFQILSLIFEDSYITRFVSAYVMGDFIKQYSIAGSLEFVIKLLKNAEFTEEDITVNMILTLSDFEKVFNQVFDAYVEIEDGLRKKG